MDSLHGRWQNRWRKSLTAITQECCQQYWTCSEGITQQNSSFTATYQLSRMLSKLDKPDMWDTAGEVRTISKAISSCRRAKAGRSARAYIQRLCTDTGCRLEDLPGTMDDRDGWRERVREIRAGSVTSWWWLGWKLPSGKGNRLK